MTDHRKRLSAICPHRRLAVARRRVAGAAFIRTAALALALPVVIAAGPRAAATSQRAGEGAESAASKGAADGLSRRTIRVPGTTVSFELRLVPAAPPAEDVADDPPPPLFVGATEVTWDLYDIFVYRLDEPQGDGRADAIARPSKPYVPPDRGFGHAGFPAMGMTHRAAERFCEWLSAVTGERFRLPSEAEWEHFALAGDPGDFACESEPGCLDGIAWFLENSAGTTRPVATKAANRWGLFDVHGNVAEWVTSSSGGRPIAKGGSYLDPGEQLAAGASLRQKSTWNASDPQIPKSEWWLADCSFVGFRVVMESSGSAPSKERRDGIAAPEAPGGASGTPTESGTR
ncbi:MAG TPA: SUMF1/EgtB/PvdO family nonheme iron enzyme [Phycisphaerales bacterium]|nr:SUMF1/EgtB/PvdO family nonheme iron enzyme [Phycisphaerales bacterium]HMP37739.1 SUMF1/EgtB/PvdO family nonheme iron enzyme [Phycisphaerales bacterium]